MTPAYVVNRHQSGIDTVTLGINVPIEVT